MIIKTVDPNLPFLVVLDHTADGTNLFECLYNLKKM